MIPVELNYNIYNKELLTIVEAFHQWSKTLSEYNFTIHYRPGQLGAKPNALTWRPNMYPKKSFETEQNAFNHRVVIPP
ncbi:hypothetical protein J132_04954 [Termitomyces sp. J132]|nr:hypothetical protein J132_04954 [Termitomyces sp. J132]